MELNQFLKINNVEYKNINLIKVGRNEFYIFELNNRYYWVIEYYYEDILEEIPKSVYSSLFSFSKVWTIGDEYDLMESIIFDMYERMNKRYYDLLFRRRKDHKWKSYSDEQRKNDLKNIMLFNYVDEYNF